MHPVAVPRLRRQALLGQGNQPLRGLAELPHDRRVQPLQLLRRERCAVRVRRQPRGVQDLVRIGTPDPGDRPLVAQKRVQPVRVLLQGRFQRGRVERRIERLRAEVRQLLGGRLRRQQPRPRPPLASSLAHRQLGVVCESHRQHRRLGMPRANGQPPRRHQVHHQHRPLRLRLEQQPLGPPPHLREAPADQRRRRRIHRLHRREVRHRHLGHRLRAQPIALGADESLQFR